MQKQTKNLYQVEAIMDRKNKGKNTLYFISRKVYHIDYVSWE